MENRAVGLPPADEQKTECRLGKTRPSAGKGVNDPESPVRAPVRPLPSDCRLRFFREYG